MFETIVTPRKVITSLCEVMQETTDEEGRKLIHLELNKERLLMD